MMDEKEKYSLDAIYKRLGALESRGEYNKDYGLDLHKSLTELMDKVFLISKMLIAHEDYLKSIDKIALHDPVKTLENMKVLFDRMDIIESMMSDVRETFARNSHIFGDHCRRIESLEEQNKLETFTTEEAVWHKKVDDRLEKLEGYMQIEDRVTASDVLIRLEKLEGNHNLRAEDIVNLRKRLSESSDNCIHNNAVLCKDFNQFIKRLEKLEQAYKADTEVEQEIIFSGKRVHDRLDSQRERIEKLEESAANKDTVADAFTQLRDNTNERLRILEQMNTENVYKPIESGKKPYKCPVCEGKINIPIYSSVLSTGTTLSISACHVCNGQGIVWG